MHNPLLSAGRNRNEYWNLEVFGDLRENLAHFLVVMQVENF
jgi:hypothetical protein